MDFLHILDRFLVISHVLAGMTALVVAPLAMLAAKGGPWHRRWGKVYFWGMAWIALSTFALMFFRFSLFLVVIAVLSFYNALSGYRVLYRKNPTRPGQTPNWIDWTAAIVSTGAGVGLALYGIGGLTGLSGQLGYIASGTSTALFVLSVAFGLGLLNTAIADIRSFKRASDDKNWWWFYHMTRMLGGYTATVTAFTVQNIGRHLPGEIAWLAWVGPALVATPLISIWVGYYRRLFAARKNAVLARAAHA